jgi:hypothetical protein
MIPINDKEKAHLLLNTSCKDYRDVVWDYDGIKVLTPDTVIKPVKNRIIANIKRFTKITINRREQNRILVGDFVKMPDGTIERITYQSKDNPSEFKTGGSRDHGGYYAHEGGYGTYSGAIGYGVVFSERMKDTGQTDLAMFWTFSRGEVEAHNGVYFYMPVRIWECIEVE